jgi:hypothetical protein
MSVFGSIMSKIFGGDEAAAKPDAQPASSTASASSAQASASPMNTAAVLTGMASKNSQQLNSRTSIVDLMKLLDLDSSLNARKELATELHYSGDTNDSASMNIWLHKQVMQNLRRTAARCRTTSIVSMEVPYGPGRSGFWEPAINHFRLISRPKCPQRPTA